MNLYEVTKQQIVNKESILNKENIDMLIMFGKKKETFDDLKIDISDVETIDIQCSEARMKDKHGSVALPETTNWRSKPTFIST